MSRAFVSRPRSTLVAAGVLAAFAVLLGRLVFLHVIERQALRGFVEATRTKFEVLEARRGDIVDARGNLLATTRTEVTLGVDPEVARRSDPEKRARLARLLGIPLAELEKRFEPRVREGDEGPRPVRWSVLAKGLSASEYESVRQLDVRGVYGNRHYTRAYPSGALAAHLLGFVNRAGTPVMGVERALDFYLRGQNGWRETERDGLRREMPRFREREVEPGRGLNVELTVDQTVQHAVEREIAKLVEEYEPESVSVIVSEPATGSILAMANHPAFDPNEYWESPVSHHRNRAVSDIFEPGSTFKIVPASAALNEHLVAPSDVLETGVREVRYRGRTIELPDDHHTYDELTMREAVVKSSNRGAAFLGMMLGRERLHEYAGAFGFGRETGFPLLGEEDGILHPPKAWDGLTITRMPMGHAVSATALQVHCAMSVLANDGVLMQPRLIRRVFERDGDAVARFAPTPKRRVVSADVADRVAGMLADVASDEGTAGKAAIEGYDVAGKTGTSEKILEEGGYSETRHIASFSGFLPADNPAVMATVVVDGVSGYGGGIAAPAFRAIARDLIPYLGIRPAGGGRSLARSDESIYDRSR